MDDQHKSPPEDHGGSTSQLVSSPVPKVYSKVELMRYIQHLNNAQQRNYRLLDNKERYYRVNCCSAPRGKFIGVVGVCQFRVYAKSMTDEEGMPKDQWVIYQLTESHTCTREESRRRTHDTRTILEVSSSLKDFVPNEQRRQGGLKQIQNIARVSEGLQIKRTQALNVLHKKRNTAIHIHVGQYMFLEPYFDLLKREDPDGTFETESVESEWKKADELTDHWVQFQRSYCAFGFAKKLWMRNTCKVLVADGTFTTSGVFRHIILLAVTKDGNNNLVLLAYCVCGAENKCNWLYFLLKLIKDFPGIEVFLSDYDKGVECDAFQNVLDENDIAYSRCVRHMLGNCAKGTKAKINETMKKHVYSMARARNKEMYVQQLEKLKKMSPEVAAWFHGRHEDYATHHFLDYGFCRYGNVLNNMAEQFNSIIQEIRSKPILDLMIGLNSYQFKQFSKRNAYAKTWKDAGFVLTPYAWDKHIRMTTMASKRDYTPHPSIGNTHCGMVNSDPMGDATCTIFVSVNSVTEKQECPCRYNDEYGQPCRDCWKVIEHSCSDSPITKWYDGYWHLDSYFHAYDQELPNISTAGRLSMTSVLPPDETSMRGRPKKARYESKSDNPKQCRACGNYGHTQQTCKTPSTEVRVRCYFDQALKYCYSVIPITKSD